MAKVPADQYQTAGALEDELTAVEKTLEQEVPTLLQKLEMLERELTALLEANAEALSRPLAREILSRPRRRVR